MSLAAFQPLRQLVDPAGDTSGFLLAVLACAFFGWLQTCKAVGYGLLKQPLAVAAKRQTESVSGTHSEHLPIRAGAASFLFLLCPVFFLRVHPAFKQLVDNIFNAGLIPATGEIGAQLGGRNRNVAL